MISVILTLVVLGFLLWLVEVAVPMDAQIRRVIQAVAVLFAVLFVLRAFGLF